MNLSTTIPILTPEITEYSCPITPYANQSQHQFFDSFEGIPFNIIFNVSAMLVCFTIYALMVVISKRGRRKGQAVFSMHRVTEPGSSLPSIWRCLTMSKDEVLHHAGLDGAAYLQTVEGSALMLFTLVPFLCIALPMYYITGHSASIFQRMTISNLDNLSPLLAWFIWAVTVFCSVLYLACSVYQIGYAQDWPRRRKVCKLWNPQAHMDCASQSVSASAECQCHLVNQIPNVLLLSGVQVVSENDLYKRLKAFFSSIDPPVSIQWVHAVKDQTRTMHLEKRRMELARSIQMCEEEIERTGTRPLYRRDLFCGLTCSNCCCPCLGKPRVDALEFYSVQLAFTERSLRQIYAHLERSGSLTSNGLGDEGIRLDFTGLVFVGLRNSKEALQVANLFSTSCNSTIPSCYTVHPEALPVICSHMDEQEKQPKAFIGWRPFRKIQLAPLSRDLLWHQLMRFRHRSFLRTILGNVITLAVFLVSLLLTSPSYLLVFINFLHENWNMNGTLGFYVQRWVPSLVLVVASALVRQLVVISENWAAHKTYSGREKIGQRRLFAFLVITVLIFPSVGIGGLPALASRVMGRDKNAQPFRLACFFVPDSSVLFINYIVTSAILGNCFNLLQLGRWAVHIIRYSCGVHSSAERRQLAEQSAGPFPFREQYAALSLIQTIVITYTPICPFILPFGFLYLLCDYLFCKYSMISIYEAYAQPDETEPLTSEAHDLEKRSYHVTWTIQSILSSLSGICLSSFLLFGFFLMRLFELGPSIEIVVAFLTLFLLVLVAAILITVIVSKRWVRMNSNCQTIPSEDLMSSFDLSEATSELHVAEYSRF